MSLYIVTIKRRIATYSYEISLVCHRLKIIIPSFLGCPFPLPPSISTSYTLFTGLSGPISVKALLHFLRLLYTFSNTPSYPSLITTFPTLSNLPSSAICLNTLISVAWIADYCCSFSTHISLLYISVGTMMALHTLNLVLLVSYFLFHTSSFNTAITLAAFPIYY